MRGEPLRVPASFTLSRHTHERHEMSGKAYQRGSDGIRRDTDRVLEAARPPRMVDILATENTRLKAENARLTVAHERARNAALRHLGTIGLLREQIAEERERNGRLRMLAQGLEKNEAAYLRSVRILWAVIKHALTPEQYHEARAIVGDEFD